MAGAYRSPTTAPLGSAASSLALGLGKHRFLAILDSSSIAKPLTVPRMPSWNRYRRVEDCKSGLEFAPRLTLENFQASESSKAAKRISNVSSQYQLRTVLADGWHCGLLLIFDNSLNKIVLSFSEKELDWSEWSKEASCEEK
jgi:hypothetical protein